MKMPPPTVENQSSSLLSTEENLQLFKMLGNRCQTLGTTVAQLFTTAAPAHAQWNKKDTGVLCFIKDYPKKNYFFRLYSLNRNVMLWEHEMYNNLEYVESAPFFHVFEGDECIVAFNFASQPEAKQFKTIVDQKIAIKKRKEKKSRPVAQTQSLKLAQKTMDIATKQELKRRRNITKADISTPTGFVHVSHVGWNPDTGFDILSDDAELKALFQEAGVSRKQLQDKETREFIYDFINSHKKSAMANDSNPPVVPPRGPPRPPSGNPRPAPPPPPIHRSTSQVENNIHRKPRPPSPPKQMVGGGPAPPPPPPPPPMMMENVPPPPPMMFDNGVPPAPSMMDGNAALLQSIRDGTTLKPVEDRRPSPVEDARSDLLSEIRKGIQLKPVDEREIKPAQNPSPTSTGGGNDLARALKQALLERSKVIHSDDENDDTSSTSNDEWDD